MPTSLTKPNNQGLTLLEILISLAIISGLLAISLPRLRTADRTKSVIRKVTVLAKQTHTNARLKGRPYRMVFDMTTEPNTLTIEIAKSATPRAVESDEKPTNSDPNTPAVTDFSIDETILRKPLELPEGYKFEDVEFSQDKKITTGRAYVYFYPQGYATRAAIHISDGKEKKFTISIHPLTGQSYAAQSYISLREME